MTKEAFKIFGALAIPALVATGCGDERSSEGTLIDKEYQPARTWIMPDGRTVTDDEDHILRVEDCGLGDTRQCETIEFFVPQNLFDTVQLGEWVQFHTLQNASMQDRNVIQK